MAYCTLGTNFLPENRASESQPPCPSSLRNKRPDLSGRPPCKGVAIGVARRGARLGGERTLRIPPSCSFPVSHSPLCIRVLRNRAPTTGWESRGWSDTHSHCSAQFTSLITPNVSIERPDAHLADGPTQDVAMANHRPYIRALTHVFHYVRCFITTQPPAWGRALTHGYHNHHAAACLGGRAAHSRRRAAVLR